MYVDIRVDDRRTHTCASGQMAHLARTLTLKDVADEIYVTNVA